MRRHDDGWGRDTGVVGAPRRPPRCVGMSLVEDVPGGIREEPIRPRRAGEHVGVGLFGQALLRRLLRADVHARADHAQRVERELLEELAVALGIRAHRRAGAAPAGSRYSWPFPEIAQKKGLQVQMVPDAIQLGVRHAALKQKPRPDDGHDP